MMENTSSGQVCLEPLTGDLEIRFRRGWRVDETGPDFTGSFAGQVNCPEAGLTLLNLDFGHFGDRESGNVGLTIAETNSTYSVGIVRKAGGIAVGGSGLKAARMAGCRGRCRLGQRARGKRHGPPFAFGSADGYRRSPTSSWVCQRASPPESGKGCRAGKIRMRLMRRLVSEQRAGQPRV